MRIIELTFHRAHGEQHFAFQAGLNVIHEANENLRGMLWTSLLAMLYGPSELSPPRLQRPALPSRSKRKQSGSRKSISEENDERFEGTLLLALNDGRKLQLRRSAASSATALQVFDVHTGKDLSAEYQHGQSFAERHLSLNRAVFAAAAGVQAAELQLFSDAEEDTLTIALSKLLDSAGSNTSIHTAIQRIDRKLAEIGTVYSSGSSMATACAQRDDLHQKRLAYLAAYRAHSDDQAEADELAEEIKILQTRQSILEHEAMANELVASRARLARYDDCQRQIDKIAGEQAALAEFKEFPVTMKEKFFQLHHDLTHLEKLQELLTGERNSLSLKLNVLAERSSASGVDESIWEVRSFEEFYALRTQWQATFEEILGLETAKHGADAALEAAGLDAADRAALAALDSPRIEVLKKREAAVKAEEQETEKFRSVYDEFQSRTQSHRRAGALIALVVLAAITVGLFHLEGRISQAKVWGGILPLLMSFGGLLLFMFLNYRWLLRSRQLAGDLLRAEKIYMDNYEELRDILSGFKVQNLGELIRQRMLFMEIGSASQDHAKRAEELARIERALLPWMEPLGLNHIAMETLMAAEKRLRESYQLWQEKKNAGQHVERLSQQLRELNGQHTRVTAEIEKALAGAQISLPPGESSFQAYVQACQKREYLETLQSQNRQIVALAEEILRGQRRDQLAEEIKRLENSIQRFAAPRLGGRLAETLNAAQVRERIEGLEKEIVAKQQALAVNRERMRLRGHASASLAEIDEALALTEDAISRLAAAQQALQIARNTLLNARQHVHHDFARRATAIISRHIKSLTAGRYSGARLDPSDFSLHLFAKKDAWVGEEINGINPAVQRRILLLIRLNMPALMAESRESIPIFVDTARRDNDSRQSANLREVLEAVAKDQQVLCITGDEKVAATLRHKTGVKRGRTLAQEPRED